MSQYAPSLAIESCHYLAMLDDDNRIVEMMEARGGVENTAVHPAQPAYHRKSNTGLPAVHVPRRVKLKFVEGVPYLRYRRECQHGRVCKISD